MLLLNGCTDIANIEPNHQKFLTPNAFNVLSLPVDDEGTPDGDIESSAVSEDDDSVAVVNEKFYRRISISANEGMQMREVLTKMAHLASVSMFIAEDIGASISFVATNRRFLDILKDICDSANLKCSINGDSVRIERDIPVLKFYTTAFLNMQRDTQSSMSISTDIFSSGSGVGTDFGSNALANTGGRTSVSGVIGSSAGLSNNGSSSIVIGSAKNDFWQELENTLKCIIGTGDLGPDNTPNTTEYVTLHRQAGVVVANTTKSKHEKIKKCLKLLKESSETQVLIEARILEVCLTNEHKSGIDWKILSKGGPKTEKFFDINELFTVGIDRTNVHAMVGFLEKFGAVKTLSSPRLTILNNYSAVLKVAKNEVIYTPELQKQYGSVSNPVSMDFISANIKTIPIGLVMVVQPSIDRKNNTIMLNIRPTISKIAGYVSVPSLLQSYNLQMASRTDAATAMSSTPSMQKIPIVDVREMDSVLQLRSGQVVVMGGLMQEISRRNRSNIPGFADTPIDWFFGSRENGTDVTELVIFLKATIVRRNGKMHHNADKKIYDIFANDSRPLKFHTENGARFGKNITGSNGK
jgi:general secretion pathway protein D